MTVGISLVGIGAAIWLVAYYLPARVIDWSTKPQLVRSMRNRVGETIARVLGPVLVVGGLVLVVTAA
jgi:hypothetical protein